MYIGTKTECERVYEENGDRWEYAVSISPTNEFVQVSFVNGIHTSKGGKHVEYILGQIVRKLVDYIEKKKKVKVNSKMSCKNKINQQKKSQKNHPQTKE
jgi:DNA topoisomerase-2